MSYVILDSLPKSGHTDSQRRKEVDGLHKLTKREKREMIAAAMKTISEHKSLTPASKERGLGVLEKALAKHSDPR